MPSTSVVGHDSSREKIVGMESSFVINSYKKGKRRIPVAIARIDGFLSRKSVCRFSYAN